MSLERSPREGNGRRVAVLLAALLALASPAPTQPVPVSPTEEPTTPEAVLLPTDRALRQKLQAAEEYIREEKWAEAFRLLQAILDNPADSFLPEEEGKDGKPAPRVSGRVTAERLLTALSPRGKAAYEVSYGGTAIGLLDAARKKGDPEALAEIVRRYAHTKAGAEALALLGGSHLERGRADLAGGCFGRLLRITDPAGLSSPTLFRAVLALRAAGNDAGEARCWQVLKERADRDGLLVAGRKLDTAQVRQALDDWKPGDDAIDWPLFRGNPGRSALTTADTPHLEAAWTISASGGSDSSRTVKLAARMAPAAVAGIPGAVPIAVGGRVFYRAPDGIHALTTAGKPIWHTPSSLSLEAVLDEPGRKVQFEYWLRYYRAAQTLLVENATIGTLSSDGTRVYAVEDLPIPPYPDLYHRFTTEKAMPFGPFREAVQHNRLRALDAATGRVVWEIGGIGKAVPKALAGGYFLGPPLPYASRLYALLDKEQETFLLCLDPETGKVEWAQILATARDKLHLDPVRRTQAAHLAVVNGVLVCPTNAGVVLGYDVLGRTLRWAYSYRQGGPRPGGEDSFYPITAPENLRPLWHASAPLVTGHHVILSAPDADGFACVDTRDGSELWKASRTEDDLFVAAVASRRVLVVGRGACRLHNLLTGEVVWQEQVGMPSGLGVLGGRMYFLPLREGGMMALDLETPVGSIRVSGPKGERLGNLLYADGHLWSQSIAAVAAYPGLGVRLRRLDRQLTANPLDVSARLERGRLHIDRGDLPAGLADLRAARDGGEPGPAAAARAALFDTLTRLLRRDFKGSEGYLGEYRDLCEHKADAPAERLRRRVQLLSVTAEGWAAQGRTLDALKVYLELFELLPSHELAVWAEEPSVRAAPATWLGRRITAIVNAANSEQARRVREWLDERGRRLGETGDLAGLRRFVALYGGLTGPSSRPVRTARMRLAERLARLDGTGGLEAETHLMTLSECKDDPDLAARACYLRAGLLTRKGLLADALACYRDLARDYPAAAVADGKTGATALADLATDKRFLPRLTPASDPWGKARLKATVVQHTGDHNWVQVPCKPIGGHSHPRLPRLALDVTANRLVVRDHSGGSEWAVPVPLNGPTRIIVQNGGHIGWLPAGHVAVVAAGPVVIAVDLLDRRLLWTRAVVEKIDPRQGAYVDPEGGISFYNLDGTQGRRLGLLGVVGPGLVYVHVASGVVALDLRTGEPRWARTDLPTRLTAFGDREYLFLAEQRGDLSLRAIRGFHTADGRALSLPDAGGSWDRRTRPLGRCLLVQESGKADEVVLRLHDVAAGRDLWKKAFPAKSVVVGSDPTFVAVVAPTGEVSVTDLTTRTEVLTAKVPAAHVEQLTGGHLLRDDRQWYLALNQPNDPAWNVMDGPYPCVYGGLSCVTLNGRLYAFDRATGEINWCSRIPFQQMITDRFDEVPVILCAAQVTRQVGTTGLYTVGLIRSLDKRTGKVVYNREMVNGLGGFYDLKVEKALGVVDLVSNQFIVRHQTAR